MDNETLRSIIVILSASFLTAGGAFVTLVAWIVMKAWGEVSAMKKDLIENFRDFGRQLAQVRELTKDELHGLENRIIALETWRLSQASAAPPTRSHGMD